MQRGNPSTALNFFQEYLYFYLIGHKNPDPDCIASQMVLASFLTRLGKSSLLLNAGPFQKSGVDAYAGKFSYQIAEKSLIKEKSAVILLDCGEFSRTGKIPSILEQLPCLVIDHHLTSGDKTHAAYIDSDSPATCVLIYRIIKAASQQPTAKEADLLFWGLADDSGFFRFLNQDQPESMDIAADLMRKGASPARIARKLQSPFSHQSCQVLGGILQRTQMLKKGHYALTWMTKEEKMQAGSFPLDFDLLYPVLLAIQGCETIVLLQEEHDDCCLGSLRSREKQDVSAIAKQLGGGGHARAAGFSLPHPLEQSLITVKKLLTSLSTP